MKAAFDCSSVRVPVILAFALVLTSCGGGNGSSFGCGAICSPPKPEILYVGSANQLQTFAIDSSTGVLGVPIALSGPSSTVDIVATPSAKFLYVSDYENNAADAFAIDPTSGALSPAGSPTLIGAGATGVGGLAIDPAGKFLYAADENASDVAAFTISSSTGELTAVGPPVATGALPARLIVDPSGRFLFVSNEEDPDGGISAYTINSASGALTPVVGSPFPTQIGGSPGPVGLAVHPNGSFLYVALWGTTSFGNSVAAFAINATTGALTPVPGSPFPVGSGPLALVVDPTGQFLITANDGDGTVSVSSIDPASGALTPVGSSFPAGFHLTGLAMETHGQFFYATDQLTNSVVTLHLSSSGVLSTVGQPVTAGQQPYAVTAVNVP